MLNMCDKIKQFLSSGSFALVCYVLCAVLQIAGSIKYHSIFRFIIAIGFMFLAYIKLKQLDSKDESETDTGCGSDDP